MTGSGRTQQRLIVLLVALVVGEGLLSLYMVVGGGAVATGSVATIPHGEGVYSQSSGKTPGEQLSELKAKMEYENKLDMVNCVPSVGSVVASHVFRFPSVDERAAYYMGDWHNVAPIRDPPSSWCAMCPYFNDTTAWPFDFPYLWDERNTRVVDALKYPEDMLKWYFANFPRGAVLPFSLGDFTIQAPFPFFSKSRPAAPPAPPAPPAASGSPEPGERQRRPIVAFLNVKRHFNNIVRYAPALRIPWSLKKDAIVWRGVDTGRGQRMKALQGIKGLLERDSRHTDFDIGFSWLQSDTPRTPENLALVRDDLLPAQQVAYKYLLSLEGNDVATGLKWQLASNSVVIMPLPTVVSWAMEDLLVPWYHYIPVAHDLSNITDALRWAREHDCECRHISQRATEYMERLWNSARAQRETEQVLKETVRRYEASFGDVFSQCPTVLYAPREEASGSVSGSGSFGRGRGSGSESGSGSGSGSGSTSSHSGNGSGSSGGDVDKRAQGQRLLLRGRA